MLYKNQMMMRKSLKKCSDRALILSYYLLVSFCVDNLVGAQKMEVKVGVVLDKGNVQGKVKLSCINMALSDWYAVHPEYRTNIALYVRDSHNHDPVAAADAVVDLIKNEEVAAIIGPETSAEAQFIVNLGKRAQVPIISYSVTSPFVSPSKNPYFIRATQDDSSQVQPLTAFIRAFGWRQVVPVYVDDEFGGGIVPFLADALQQIGTTIPYRSVIPSSASKDKMLVELYKLKSLSCRVFIVHMPPFLGSQLFLTAQESGMMSKDYVWIITDAMGNDLSNLSPRVIQAMRGVVGVETYVPQTRELNESTVRWKTKFQQENPSVLDAKLNVYGLWAYDATVALARAVELLSSSNFKFQKSAGNAANFSSDITTMGVSQVGPELLQRVLHLSFKGLSGNFALSDGEIKGSTFRLINIWEGGMKGIHYWTLSNGLVKQLSSADSDKPGTLVANNHESIRWPGDVTSFPRGWVSSPNGKKLRIGVPIKDGFQQFVQVTHDAATHITKVEGFCIDVFDAVMSKLPYSVPYEYIPYTDHPSKPTDSYDVLVNQVYQKNFDAVVGDITIRANRSTYVDFTLPFTESGVIMIVPLKDNKRIRFWLFVMPLTRDLWVTIFCFFLFIAFVVWVLEHRINEDFRGPPGHQVGTSLYYSFSTMVFSHRENVLSNLTRCVVLVWVFVVLILTQSYTASLASLLTVQHQPNVTGVDELLSSGAYVGFQDGSFVKDLLKQKGFHESKIISYYTSQNLNDLLSNGTVSAVFDEIPYMRLFIAQFPSKYTMQPIYKTDGFGFAFQKGSPLAIEVSGEILRVTEGDEMSKFESKWGMQEYNSSDQGNIATSARLGLDSFGGLFIIVGVASGLSLLIFSAQFLYESRDIWMDSDASFWSKIQRLAKSFEKRDMSAHTFRKRDTPSTQNVENDQTSIDGDGVDEITPTASNIPPRLSNYSDRTEENLSLSAGASPPRIHIDTISD